MITEAKAKELYEQITDLMDGYDMMSDAQALIESELFTFKPSREDAEIILQVFVNETGNTDGFMINDVRTLKEIVGYEGPIMLKFE